MSARASPTPSLRPYLASDLPILSEIRYAAIEELAAEDYDEEQCRAWASAADKDEAFAQSLQKGLTIVALVGGRPVGFISMQEGALIDQLYVDPAVARTGIASTLCDAIERLAAARGITRLAVDASDTARPLFEKRGYVAQHRNTIEIEGQWLGNTRMTKVLAAEAAPNRRQ
jgi:putative acetyltransferase